jgi:hypothetical protein
MVLESVGVGLRAAQARHHPATITVQRSHRNEFAVSLRAGSVYLPVTRN